MGRRLLFVLPCLVSDSVRFALRRYDIQASEDFNPPPPGGGGTRSVTEGAEALRAIESALLTSPSDAFGATSPLRGRI